MQIPEDQSPDQLREYLDLVKVLEHGEGQIAAAEMGVKLAEQLRDEELLYQARETLMTAAVFSGRPDLALVHFSWMLAKFDGKPSLASESMLLWQYKWVITRLAVFPQIPKQRILETLADMERRYQRFGQGQHALHKIRRTIYQQLGDEVSARKAHQQFLKTERDMLSDCAACVPSSNVSYYVSKNQEERAFIEATPILRGELRCASVPHSTYSNLLLPMLKKGRGEEAMVLHRKGYRLVERNPEHVDDAAKHMLFLAMTGNYPSAIRLLERHAPVAVTNQDILNRLYFALRAHLTLLVLQDNGYEELKLRLPADFPVAGERGVYQVPALIKWFLKVMTEIAELMDKRNGNSAYMKLVRSFRRNKKYCTPIPLRKS